MNVKMELKKDLTAELLKAEAKDRYYKVTGTLIRLLAPQDPRFVRQVKYEKTGWGKITRFETIEDGTPTATRSPRKNARSRKGDLEVKEGACWSFRKESDQLLLPWATSFGVFKGSLRRSLNAQRKLRYDAAPLDLIRVYPTWLPLGKAPSDSEARNLPEIILETRHTQRGDVMVEAFFDFVENRKIDFVLEIDSECPLNDEKLIGLLKSLNTLDNIGASKRGRMEISTVEQIELGEKDLESLDRWNYPETLPVIY